MIAVLELKSWMPENAPRLRSHMTRGAVFLTDNFADREAATDAAGLLATVLVPDAALGGGRLNRYP